MTKRRVILIGAGGQLAHDLFEAFREDDVVGLTRQDLDLTQPDLAKTKLKAEAPDLVINAAAYNLVDQAESEPEAAFAVNAFGPRTLAQVTAEIGCTLIHFSTDYVFGLEAGRPSGWLETDAPGPNSVYGTSKLAGEYFCRSLCPRHFVLRTCGLYGFKGSRGKGGNFVETMLRLADTGKPVRVVNDQRCTPSFTADIARFAAMLSRTTEYGLYHVTNSGSCTWFELARKIFEIANKSVECLPITSSEFGAKANRPPNSALDVSKLARAVNKTPPAWEDALGRYLAGREQGRKLTA